MNPFNQQQNNKGKKKGSNAKSPLLRNILTSLAIFVVLVVIYSLIVENNTQEKSIPLSQLAADISAGKVTSVTVKDTTLNVIYTNGDKRQSQKEVPGQVY